MSISFRKAERHQRKFKGLINGPSGSGKTYTALEIATGLKGEGPICLLDTERGSASLYSDKFDFLTDDLIDTSVKGYLAGVNAAIAAGASVLIIDSLSHAWESLLQEAEDVAARSSSKNSYAAWKKVTPIYWELVKGIVFADIHIICTTRAKTDYVMEEVEKNGRTTIQPRKVGLAPIFRQGGEYEFDWIGTIELDHTLLTEKSRIDVIADKVVRRPDRKLGEQIRDWLLSAKPETFCRYDVAAMKEAFTSDEQQQLMRQVYKDNNASTQNGQIVTRREVPEWSAFLIKQ